jgi:hypothetical protein
MSVIKDLVKPKTTVIPKAEETVAMPTQTDSAEERRRQMKRGGQGRGRDSTYLSDGAYQNTVLGS